MTELDLGLKVGTRSLLWSMGFSTRLDVVLRADERPQRGKSGVETFTDLDVLGVAIGPGYRLTTTIADCKTGARDRSTARMFWARGVADLFEADDVMLVRDREVNDATRQLSNRLGITVLSARDLTIMQQLHGEPQPRRDGPLQLLFDRESVVKQLSAFNSLDKKLQPLLEYRNFDYWIYDQHRNPFQLVAHLREARRVLDPKNPIHLALFLDFAWLYLLSLVRVTEYIRGAHLQDPDRALQEFVFGGAIQLREKQDVAALLQAAKPSGAKDNSFLPPYFSSLRELVTRLLRRPTQIGTGLRYAEASSALMAARVRTPLIDAVGPAHFDPIAAKLVADVCGFLVAAGDLHTDFRAQARAYLMAEPVAGPSATPSTTPSVSGTYESDAPRTQLAPDGVEAGPGPDDTAPRLPSETSDAGLAAAPGKDTQMELPDQSP